MTDAEKKQLVLKHAEELAAPIMKLLWPVVAKGMRGVLEQCIEMQERINQLEAENSNLRASSAAQKPDCGACPGDGTICPTTCKLADDSPPCALTPDAGIQPAITQANIRQAVLSAVAALYFADSSGYQGALYSVVRNLAPDMLDELDADPRKAFEKAQELVGSGGMRDTSVNSSGSPSQKGVDLDSQAVAPVEPDLKAAREAMERAKKLRIWDDINHALHIELDIIFKALAAPSTPAVNAGLASVRLAASRERRIYIAGPMTGLPEFNFPAFHDAALLLRAEGWHVENPAEHGIVDGATWADYLHYDLERLATCGAIYLLPGWSKSRGAALEAHIATGLGMTIKYAPGAETPATTSASSKPVPTLTKREIDDVRFAWDRLHAHKEDHACQCLVPLLSKLESVSAQPSDGQAINTGEIPAALLELGDWLNMPESSDDEPMAVREYRYEAFRRWKLAVAASKKQAIEYTPGKWSVVRTIDEMQAFYMSRLQAIRQAAKDHGYAIGLHGSTRRDFDLMAMQWRDDAADKDTLAHAIAVAACGITRDGEYEWAHKPSRRFAVSIPICWTDNANQEFKNKPSVGHIDLSVIDHAPTATRADSQPSDAQAPATNAGGQPELNGPHPDHAEAIQWEGNTRLVIAPDDYAELWEAAHRHTAASAGTQPDAQADARDAARYRWLRNDCAGQFEHPIVVSQHHEVGKGMRYMGPVISGELDRLIDAAMSKEQQS